MRRIKLTELLLLSLPLVLFACESTRSRNLDAPSVTHHHVPRVEPVDAEHYALELSIDPDLRRIDGLCRVRLVAVKSGVSKIDLDLQGLVVDAVQDGEGRALDYRRSGDRLRVTLAEALEEGEMVELTVEYGGVPQAGMWFTGRADAPSSHVFTQGECEGARSWFPCLDYPADRATSELRIEMPADWIAVCAGERIDQGAVEGGRRFEHWRMATPHPTYLTTLVAGDLALQTDEWEGVPLQYIAPEVYADWIIPALGQTPEVLTFLSELTGHRYPYPKYAQACVEDFPFGGMENISATTLSCQTLTDSRGRRDRSSIGLVVHEAAHQWFGDLLTCREWSHIWLNEGFATYCTLLWFEATEGSEAFRVRMRDTQDHYVSQDVGANRRPTVYDVYRDPMDLFFGGHAYQGGAARLHLLRWILGDADFFAGIEHYVAENQGRGVRTDDLRVALEEASGKDLERVFDEWFYSAGYPSFAFTARWEDGEVIAEIEQLQEGGVQTPNVFHLPIEIEVRGADRSHFVRVELESGRETVRISSPEEPRWVRLDPHGWIPKHIKVTRPAKVWMDIAQHCEDPNGRRDAIGVIAQAIATEEDEAAAGRMTRLISERLAEDSSEGVRIAAAEALTDLTNPFLRGALVNAATHDESAQVRVAALRSLLTVGHDAVLGELAEQVFRDAYSWRVMAAAAGLRASAKPEDAFDWVLGHSVQPSPHGELEAEMLDVLGLIDDPRLNGVLLRRALDPERHANVRTSAIRTLGRVADGDQEVLTALLGLLDEPNYTIRQATIRAVGELDELAAHAKLSAIYRHSVDPRERRLIEEVARDLRE